MQQTSLSAGRGSLALGRQAVPDHAPPYDGDPDLTFTSITTGNGLSSWPVRTRAGSTARAPVRAVAPDPASGPAAEKNPRTTPPGQAATGPAGWPGQFAQILAETLAGARPARQLTPWTTEQARRQIRQLGQHPPGGQRPTVRRLMTSAPAQDVLELTAVVGFGPRLRVLALRLERDPAGARPRRGRAWCCTEIESA